MFELTKHNISKIGFVLGLIYTIYFNSINETQGDYVMAFFFSIPFILISLLISYFISIKRKDKFMGVYFCIIILIFLSIKK
jgi:hypothetical protein